MSEGTLRELDDVCALHGHAEVGVRGSGDLVQAVAPVAPVDVGRLGADVPLTFTLA